MRRCAATLNPRMNSVVAKALMAAQYALTRRGPLTMAPCQLGLFARSAPGVDRADLGWNVLAFSRAAFDAPFDDHPGLTMTYYDLRTSSRGRLRSADAHDPPRILMNYLASARDRQVAADGLRLTRRIMAAAVTGCDAAGACGHQSWQASSAKSRKAFTFCGR